MYSLVTAICITLLYIISLIVAFMSLLPPLVDKWRKKGEFGTQCPQAIRLYISRLYYILQSIVYLIRTLHYDYWNKSGRKWNMNNNWSTLMLSNERQRNYVTFWFLCFRHIPHKFQWDLTTDELSPTLSWVYYILWPYHMALMMSCGHRPWDKIMNIYKLVWR